MKKNINIAVVGLGQIGIYLLNELNTKKNEIELKTGKRINVVAVSARNKNKKRQHRQSANWVGLSCAIYRIVTDNIQWLSISTMTRK